MEVNNDAKEEKSSALRLAPGKEQPAGPELHAADHKGGSKAAKEAPPSSMAPLPHGDVNAAGTLAESKEFKSGDKTTCNNLDAVEAAAAAGGADADAESKQQLAPSSPRSRIEIALGAAGGGGGGGGGEVVRLLPSGTPRDRTFLVQTTDPEEPQVWETDTYKSLPKSGDGRQLRFIKLLLPAPKPAETVPWEVAWRETRLPVVIATRKGLLDPSVHTASVVDKIHAESESVLDQVCVCVPPSVCLCLCLCLCGGIFVGYTSMRTAFPGLALTPPPFASPPRRAWCHCSISYNLARSKTATSTDTWGKLTRSGSRMAMASSCGKTTRGTRACGKMECGTAMESCAGLQVTPMQVCGILIAK